VNGKLSRVEMLAFVFICACLGFTTALLVLQSFD
jgi:hypothetical protein